MLNKFCKKPLYEVTRTMARVAMGVQKAETVIKNARLVNVCTAEIQEGIDVAIAEGRIALVGDASHCIGPETKVIDAGGQYIAPGFMDGHIHVESSMISVGEYAKAVVPCGTTGIFMDPHEICNVCGKDGVRIMIEDAKRSPLKAMSNAPSCVPAVAGFEDTGAAIRADDIREMMTWDGIMGLGEMMSFPNVIGAEENIHAELAETLKSDNIITGHFSIPDTGAALNAYIASGIRCCHESTRAEDALAKMRLGMYAMLREGSAWHDLQEVSKAITEHKVDSRFATMISDDTHPHTLVANGHLDHIVRRAVSFGIDFVTAIQMVTLNCAQCFQMDHELGSITPGKCADIVFIDNEKDIRVTRVLIDGDVVAENGKLTIDLPKSELPAWALDTMHVGETITPETFKVHTDKVGTATVRAIEIIPVHVGDYERHVELKVENGELKSDVEQDVLKTFVFERHNKTGKHGVGFVKGFHVKCGAMASTVAHDAHNLLVVGTNDEDMALAANTLIQCGGGECIVQNGKVLGCVPLPFAGLMNTKSAEEMDELVEDLGKAWETIGCDIQSPFMTMALIPLACLPELRLTDRGLVDCTTFSFADLEVE